MNEQEKTTTNPREKALNFLAFLTKHRLIFVIMVIGAALVFALFRTNSYVDVSRNETRYNEESLKINYKEIDSETLAEFKAADEDGKIQVDANFDPDRQNPFYE